MNSRVGGCAYRCVGAVCVFRYWRLVESMYGCFVGLAYLVLWSVSCVWCIGVVV